MILFLNIVLFLLLFGGNKMEFKETCPNYDLYNYDCKEDCGDCPIYQNFLDHQSSKRLKLIEISDRLENRLD